MLGIHRDPCVREMVELYERFGHRVFLIMPIFFRMSFFDPSRTYLAVRVPRKYGRI